MSNRPRMCLRLPRPQPDQGVAIFSGGAHVAGNDRLRQHAESKTRSGVAPRPGCPFNPSQSSRAKNLHRRGGPGHGSEKRINLSTSELCSEAPVLCAQSQSQEKITSRAWSICGMPRPARGASYRGETLCVARSERAREQRQPGGPSAAFLALLPATPRTVFAEYFGLWSF